MPIHKNKRITPLLQSMAQFEKTLLYLYYRGLQMFRDRTMKNKLPSALAALMRSIPACLSLAVLTLVFFACLENTNAPNDTGLSPGLNQPPNNGEQVRQYIYCVFTETEMCLAGPFSECEPGGELSNNCPFNYLGAGSGADINPNANGTYNYCDIPEDKICLEGPFSECPKGEPANECSYASISSSSEAAVLSSSSKENAISSASEEEVYLPPSSSTNQNPSSSSTQNSSSSTNQNPSSSSSEVTGPSLCEDFNPNERVDHRGKQKYQICDERDGKRYPYVEIGKQTWLAKNLDYRGENGSLGLCYDYLDAYCTVYGRMYRFTEIFCSSGNCAQADIVDPGKLENEIACPYGWHLPSTGELEALWTTSDPDFLPGNNASGNGNNSAGAKLKVTSWSGTDEYGFAALPGGYCGDGCGKMYELNNMSYWWHYGFGYPVTLTKSWALLNSAVVNDSRQSLGSSAFYVRCIKNAETTSSLLTPISSLPCSGTPGAGQECHLGAWKNVFTDPRDNEKYPYVTIQGQTWMAKNLNYDAGEGSVCYDNLEANCGTHGRLYHWDTMMDLKAGENAQTAASNNDPSGRQGVCPDGWHLPSVAEWTRLLGAADGSGTNNLTGASAALKAKFGWEQNAGTDALGFAALPSSYGVSLAGARSRGGFGTAKGGFWWTTSRASVSSSYVRHIGPTSPNVKSADNDFGRLYSVRCVKD
jgi:uncharacterized protein (TIGR02145 family)